MGQFFNSINDVRKNYSTYDQWEQKQADKKAQKEYLSANNAVSKQKLEQAKKQAETVIRATEIMDARSEDNCANTEQIMSMLMPIPVLGTFFGANKIFECISNKVNKNLDNKINDLCHEMFLDSKDLNKIENLKEELDKLHLQQVKTKNKMGFISSIGTNSILLLTTIGTIFYSNSKQKEASRIGRYQAKQHELKDIKNFVIYTPEQIEEAQKIAKNIPDKKEREGIFEIIHQVKDVYKDEKAYKKWLSNKKDDDIEKLNSVNLTPPELKKAKENKELINNIVKDINIKAEEFSENLENTFDTLRTLSWLIAIPFGYGINKLLTLAKASKNVKFTASTAIPILTSLGISLVGTTEQKKASRIGRFKAKEEILNNPSSLIKFSDEEMQQAKNVKAKKQKQSLFEKVNSSFSFLFTYLKDKKAYNEYKKTTYRENEKLQKALKEVEITDSQRADAKTLQKNVYKAFDEIDEMSQRYSEDIEAGTEIAKQLIGTSWTLGSLAGVGILAGAVFKGKVPIVKIGNWLTNIAFDAKSPIKNKINNIYETLKKQDKSTIQDFQSSLVSGKISNFLTNPKNNEIKKAVNPLIEEVSNIISRGVMNTDVEKNVGTVFSTFLNTHFKQTPIAKWTRDIISQICKLYINGKFGTTMDKNMQKQLGLNFNYKNYKTLINSSIITSAPILGTIFALPYMFNSWLTDIQKKAGKIGIMKAMDNLEDPRLYAAEKQAS